MAWETSAQRSLLIAEIEVAMRLTNQLIIHRRAFERLLLHLSAGLMLACKDVWRGNLHVLLRTTQCLLTLLLLLHKSWHGDLELRLAAEQQ